MYYAVISREDGRLESLSSELPDPWPTDKIVHVLEQFPEGKWRPDSLQFIPDPEPAYPILTRYAFRKRFTDAEKVAIEIASMDDPTATMQRRGQAALLRAYLKDLDAANFVNLSHDATRNGVLMLEQVGLLASGRAKQILDAPVTFEEAEGV